ncbi:DUF5131 family protein [Sphingomonas sp. SRS2]|uniref:DUF5131 family protein n=1 Tax=Sphingomonas sp. SRS2 TaxID=133190 RepID=UPI0006183FA9|nr:phage Gp37/Gp68 family protein [Sphingomonas sp. SRS2]KKC24915.1 hypothetical protein WP12_16970 [Sphingomonas sp. SRS2]
MADGTKIEWTDATWNPITGCSVHSAGCTNCYAMRLAGTRLQHHRSRAGLTIDTKAGPVWNGEVRFSEQWLGDPLRWSKPRRIFVVAHGDLFHEAVPDAWIDRVFAVMALCPQHQFQVLTKRADRMRAYFAERQTAHHVWRALDGLPLNLGQALIRDSWYGGPAGKWPLPNVWLGVSVEDQRAADERIPHLLQTPAAKRWISAEPLLGPLDLSRICIGEGDNDPALAAENGIKHIRFTINSLAGVESFGWPGVDWVVAGGESGNGARPMHPDWVRGVRDQCAAAGVAFLFKQWGSWREAQPDDVFDTAKGRANKPPAFIVKPDDGTVHCFLPEDADPRCRVMLEVGKGKAGRLLDGVEHNGFPS